MRINEDYNDEYEEFLHGNCHQWVMMSKSIKCDKND